MDSLNTSLTPPQNYLAEEILLGSILINPSIFSKTVNTLKIEAFFLECNQLIYINLLKVYHSNKLNSIELLYSLSENNNLENIGGINKIIDLMKQSQVFIYSNNTNIYLDELIKIINQNYAKRLMIQYGYNIIQLAYMKKLHGNSLYNKASHYLNITVEKMPKNYINNLEEIIGNVIFEIHHKKQNKFNYNTQQKIEIKSGFKEIDKLTYGLPNGDLIILAARPSMGKTSLAINIANNILKKSKYSICIFSLEMSSKQILHKFISIASRISQKQLTNHSINNYQWQIIKKICRKLLNNHLYIHDKTNISIDYIEYIAKIWKNSYKNTGLIIVDYLQLIQFDMLNNLHRVQQLSYITRKLKMLAQYLNLPILTLSQLNRNIELRINKEPILSDLKESGCINTYNTISIVNYNNYNLYLKSLFFNNSNTNQLFKTKLNYLYIKDCLSNNHLFNILILIEHLFIITVNKHTLKLTYNHKCLKKTEWININKLLDYVFIDKLRDECLKNTTIIYKKIANIIYYNYHKVYDISMIKYMNFISNRVILHNSIEQDADIILMLYDKNTSQYNKQKNEKVMDITIAKNRNGPIGYCQLSFSLNNTVFKNISETKL